MNYSIERLDNIKPTCDIPNIVGFKLKLVLALGEFDFACVPAIVQKDANGLHVCVDGRGNYRLCTAFDGWVPA